MKKAEVVVKKVAELVEELAGLIIYDANVNEYFVELYGMEVEDNPIYYANEYIHENIMG